MEYRILVVDDSRTQRAIIKKIIGMTGVEIKSIIEAENGKDALQKLDENDINIIFTDINMPEMNGEEMIEILRQHEILSKIPVVVITSKGSDATREKLEAKGIYDFLTKPFSPEDVSEVLEKIVEE